MADIPEPAATTKENYAVFVVDLSHHPRPVTAAYKPGLPLVSGNVYQALFYWTGVEWAPLPLSVWNGTEWVIEES